MTFFNNGAGISITGSEIFFARKVFEDKRLIISDTSSTSSDQRIADDISEISLISLLDEVLEKSDKSFEEISFTFPLSFYTSFFFPLEEKLSDDEIRAQLLWEFSMILPEADSEQYSVSFYVSELLDKRYVNAFALKKRNIEILQKFALRKNIKLKFVDHPAISAVNALRGVNKSFADTPVLFFYFEESEFSVLLVDDNQIKRHKTVSFSPDTAASLLESEKKYFSDLLSADEELTVTTAGKLSDEVNQAAAEILKPLEINYLEKLSSANLSAAESAPFAPILGLFLRVS